VLDVLWLIWHLIRDHQCLVGVDLSAPEPMKQMLVNLLKVFLCNRSIHPPNAMYSDLCCQRPLCDFHPPSVPGELLCQAIAQCLAALHKGAVALDDMVAEQQIANHVHIAGMNELLHCLAADIYKLGIVVPVK
jgi:hypothetical protein